MARLQQCCLFHDLLLPLLCNQAVASETSRMASSSCVAKKKKKREIKYSLKYVWCVLEALLALIRADEGHVWCSPGWGKVVMQQWDGSWCKELPVSEPTVTPVQLLSRLSLLCWWSRHSGSKNLSSHLYGRWSTIIISLHEINYNVSYDFNSPLPVLNIWRLVSSDKRQKAVVFMFI